MSYMKFVPLPVSLARAELQRLGHFHEVLGGRAKDEAVEKITDSDIEFRAAVESYQRFSGLAVDGIAGKATQTALRWGTDAEGLQRVCGCPDVEPLRTEEELNIPNGTQSWPDPSKPIVFAYDFKNKALPGLTATDTAIAFQRAFADINAKVGVRLKLGRWEDAHVRMRLKGLGGGTLAIALLSLGSRKIGAHYQNYDSSNRSWHLLLAQAVIIHETGHTLGFSHSRSSADIMYPTANAKRNTLQPGDVKTWGKIYGGPFDDDTPVPPVDPPDDPFMPGEQSFSGILRVGSRLLQFSPGSKVHVT